MRRLPLWLCFVCGVVAMGMGVAGAQEKASAPTDAGGRLALVDVCVCEQIQGSAPVNRGVVFSSSLETIYCYTAFDPVPSDTVVYHEWYRKDKLKRKVKLSLKTPRWSTFSTKRISKSDQGPWRVVVVDAAGTVLATVRFSVTE